ncbi:MAG: hypothetical protein LC640_00535 [Frankia sp.]|nr:hypothetical protein [Frankia sp.]
MRLRALVLATCLLAAPLAPLASAAPAYSGDPVAEGVGKDLRPVAHITYKSGTDLEFATVKGRDYAVAPSESSAEGGLRLIDITKPERPKLTGFLPCAVTQNDVQVRGTIVLMGVDGGVKSDVCFEQLDRKPSLGLFVISIANPAKPRAIGFVPVPYGVHNSTWHPGGRYVYTSDSELTPKSSEQAGAMGGRVQIIDLANLRKPKLIRELPLPANVLSSHDITFNKAGTRAYMAAISTTLIADTTDPANPKIITTIVDPTINISHGADPTPDGKYLLVTDEQAGAAANGVCNVGGVHVFDISVELAPVKVGFYSFDPTNSIADTTNSGNLTCTAHVLDYAANGKTWSNAGYSAGVRIVSATSLLVRPTELAYFTPNDADTWSAKTYKNPRYLFANDLNRGFDVYRWEPGAGAIRTTRPGAPTVFRGPTTFRAGSYCFTAGR